MTPYQTHETLGHAVTRYSPNGIDVIEECSVCGARYLLAPGHAPATMRRKWSKTQHELAMAYDAHLKQSIAQGRKGSK